MHFIATNSPVFKDWALKTSENVPSPNFLISLYSFFNFKKMNFTIIHFIFLFILINNFLLLLFIRRL